MAFWLILLFHLVSTATSQGMEKIPFHKCPSGNTVSAILMDPCYNRANSASSPPRCTLYHGSFIKVNAIFIAPFSSSDLEIVAIATINGNSIPLPDAGSNPCYGGIIPGCPVMKDKMYIFSAKFDVLRAFPTGSMDVQYAVRDRGTKKLLGCAIIPIVIKRAIDRKEF